LREGCQLGQGYLYGKPVAADELLRGSSTRKAQVFL
jgi:EAL domain-containing protein (putative c-di-GMP-specific phosphodiesterase class I)